MSVRNGEIELQERYGENNVAPGEETTQISSTSAKSQLPSADSGWQAYLFLSGCFVIETLVWGFPFSFGVLQEYYLTHEPISAHPQGVTAVGTTCSGLMYLAGPVVFALFQRYPSFCRNCKFYGLPIMVLALITSAFATTVWQLVLTQGVLYAIGAGLLYYPVFIFIDEWFIRRKGFAFGIMWAGSGTGGLAGPLLLSWGLTRFGQKTFLLGWAVGIAILTAPFLYFVKPRLPPSAVQRGSRSGFAAGFGFISLKTFWVLQFANIVQGLGYFIPSLYLPLYARSLGLTPLKASLILSALNTASVPGVVCLSTLCDYMEITKIFFISALGSTLSVFLLWGFSNTVAPLAVFAVLYGFFAGGFSSTYAGTVKEIRRQNPSADLGSILGLLGAGRGIGNVLCGPLAEALLRGRDSNEQTNTKVLPYASSYGPLIIFTGLTAAVSMSPWFLRKVKVI